MDLSKIQSEFETARQAYQAISNTASREDRRAASDKVRELSKRLQLAIASGANPCPTCGSQAIGMTQPYKVRGVSHDGYEVGCPQCLDHAAFGVTPEAAVAAFNAGVESWRNPQRAAVYAKAVASGMTPGQAAAVAKSA